MMTTPAPLFTLSGPAEASGLRLSRDERFASVLTLQVLSDERVDVVWNRLDLRDGSLLAWAVDSQVDPGSRLSADGRQLYVCDPSRGDVRVIDFESRAETGRLPWTVTDKLAPDDSASLEESARRTFRLVERSGQVRWTQTDPAYEGWHEWWRLGPSCLVLATEMKGRHLRVLDARTGEVLNACQPKKTPSYFHLSPAGDRLVGNDLLTGQSVYLDVLSGQVLPRPALRKRTAFAFSPDGAFLAAASEDGQVALLTDDAGRQVGLLATGAPKPELAWSADGQRLVTFSTVTGQLAVWDVASLLPGVTIATAPAATIEARVRASSGKAAPKATKGAAKTPQKAAAKAPKATGAVRTSAAKKAVPKT